jgi:hypothetical protein
MRTVAGVLTVVMILAGPVLAQAPPQAGVWRAFAERVEVGSRIAMRLSDGRRIQAVLVQAAPDGLLVQPRTRVPVPVQQVPYGDIVSIERVEGRGIGAGKAVALGVASGVGAALGTFLLIIAAFD